MEKANVEGIKERLDPSRLREELALPENPGDLKKQVTESLETKQEEKQDAELDPRAHKEYPFDFEWTDGRKKVWKGKFKNRILDIGDRQAVGVLRARMGANVPSDSLDPLTQEINLMLAHMTFSLIERPEWAKDLRSLTDVRLLQELYSEVLAHEGTFLGYGSTEEAG